MSNLNSLIADLEQIRDQYPDNDVDPVRMQDVMNSWLKNEGRRSVQARYDVSIENGGEPREVALYLARTLALRGADDTWSGRTNDARRVFHEGRLERIESLLQQNEIW